MSLPKSRYPWVPVPSPNPTSEPSSSSLPPGLRLTGSRTHPRGRSLRATRAFPAGSALAIFAHPLLALPDGAHARTVCDWCLRAKQRHAGGGGAAETTKLAACTGCGYVVYCGRPCQAAAWRAGHRRECAVLRAVGARLGVGKGKEKEWVVPTPVRAAVQLLLRLGAGDEAVRRAVGEVPFVGGGGPASGREGGELEGNVDGFRTFGDGRVWTDLGAQAMAALKFAGLEMDEEKMQFAAEAVREVLCKLQTNAFDMRDEDVGAAGIFLDVGLAMANHSCLPNAYVCFAGRTAILRAERDINEGEEIEISYIDNTRSKAERREALRLYHFECHCRRCQDDLDVYQVCQSSSVIPLNTFSLQPNVERYASPPINRTALRKRGTPPQGGSQNQRLWEACKPLVDAKMYAVEPLPSILHELVIRYETEEQNFAYALSLACFLATQCHPYAHVAPFKPWRVKGTMMIAQLLSQTAPLSAMGELAKTCPNQVLVDRLSKMDQVSMCEAVLRLVAYYGPMAHSDDWQVAESARELLDDIGQLQGRERESALIRAWSTAPERPDARAFFDAVVLGPINELAGFAVEILANELSGQNSLALRSPPTTLRRLVYTS